MLSQLSSASRRPLCKACQSSLSLASSRTLLRANSSISRRHRSQDDAGQFQPRWLKPQTSRQGEEEPGKPKWPKPKPLAVKPTKPPLDPKAFLPPTPPSAYSIVRLLLQRLPEYIRSDRFRLKLNDYGLPVDSQTALIKEWHAETTAQLEQAKDEQTARIVLGQGEWDEENLVFSFNGEVAGFAGAADSTFHRKFVKFLSTHPHVSGPLQTHLKAILDVTDLTNLAFDTQMMNARAMTRHFHLHIGPTNSGKTYNALKALAGAETGAYAGPLRLLAHEVWERLNMGTVGGLDGQGKPCNLLTGEERRIVDPDAQLTSCTVEMIPLSGPIGGFDVVVIDEIQMMGDPHRGGAWTRAVIGVCAKEIHLCGDETTLELLENLIPSLGDTLTVHRYQRLTPLQVADESLEGDWNKVEEGDCVVTFSRNNIYAIKKKIESTAAKKCAVVYGALPPETRADQAKDFNDENGRSQVLVASDAVGMGLNLWVQDTFAALTLSEKSSVSSSSRWKSSTARKRYRSP
jgi:ATP-dependent RNA helicase SUPV3L1/SUV3